MKKIVLPLILLTFCTCALFGQNEFGFGVPWQVWVIKSTPGGQPFSYPGRPVEMTVEYKDAEGQMLYKEDHEGTTSPWSDIYVVIGQGTNPTPVEGLPAADYGKIAKLCWTITVHTVNGPVVITEMHDVGAVPKAKFSQHAASADRIGNTVWRNQPLTIETLGTRTYEENFGLLSWKQEESKESKFDTIIPFDLNGFVDLDTTMSELSGAQENVIRFGSGSGTPLVFGASTPAFLNSLMTFCIPPLVTKKHGVEFKVATQPPDGHSPPKTHTTAAVFADNTESPLSAGVLANGQTWGLYGTGQNGTVGISNGSGSGAAIWGSVAQAPETGGFKYALYGNSMSHAGSWAAALFGNGFYTGTWSMSSDARLKTEIRAQSNALDKVMQLRPAQYRYRQDTPYSLPEGLHHGFLAQEMEEVFPELVSDISMPLDSDPQNMHTSETTRYKAINYIEMITILTSAVQELNGKVDTQKKEIEELRAMLNAKSN